MWYESSGVDAEGSSGKKQIERVREPAIEAFTNFIKNRLLDPTNAFVPGKLI